MKTFVYAVFLLLLAPTLAHAYSSQAGLDPTTTTEIETKAVLKLASSPAMAIGDILTYDTTAADGYTVTQVGATSVVGNQLVACVAMRAFASATVTYVPGTAIVAAVAKPCITKGLALAKYDASAAPISAGEHVCVNSVGAAVNCGATASASSQITSLQTVLSGTGTNLKVLVNAR